MKLIKIDRKTGKKYIINVPDWDVPIIRPQNVPLNSTALDLAISSHSGSLSS